MDSLHGVGDYKYECTKPDCWYCERFYPKKVIPEPNNEYKKDLTKYFWSRTQTTILKYNVDRLSFKQIGDIIGKTELACMHRFRRIGLKNKKRIENI